MKDGSIGTVKRKAYTRRSAREDAWLYHLKELAGTEEPLRYMRRYLPGGGRAGRGWRYAGCGSERRQAEADVKIAALDPVGFADRDDLFEVVLAVDELELAPLLNAERAEDHVGDTAFCFSKELAGLDATLVETR